MSAPIRKTIHGWARASNRRRLAEESLIALTWVAIALVVAAGVLRLGDLLLGLEWVGGPRWPSKTAQWAFALWVTGWVAKITGGRALWRYRKRRTRPRDFARWLDARHQTQDLWVTALAIERASQEDPPAIAGDPRWARLVLEHAQTRLGELRAPIEPFREPMRTIAAVGIAAALLALLPSPAEALALQDRFVISARDRLPPAVRCPPLSSERLLQLQRHALALESAAQAEALPLAVREVLLRWRARVEALHRHPESTLVALAWAERDLAALREALAGEGHLHRGLQRDLETAWATLMAAQRELLDQASLSGRPQHVADDRPSSLQHYLEQASQPADTPLLRP